MQIQHTNTPSDNSDIKKVRVSIKKQEETKVNSHICGLKELKNSVVNLTIMLSKLRADQHALSNTIEFIKNNICLDTSNNVNNTWSDPNYKKVSSITYEEQMLIKTGKYPIVNKIRLIYFKGLRKGKFNNVKLLLFSVGIKAFQIINISFIGKQIFELITKDQYVDHIILSLHSLEITILPKFNPCLSNTFENGTQNVVEEINLSTEKFHERIKKGLTNKSRDQSKIPKLILEQLLQCNHVSISKYLLSTYNNLNNLVFNQVLPEESTIQ